MDSLLWGEMAMDGRFLFRPENSSDCVFGLEVDIDFDPRKNELDPFGVQGIPDGFKNDIMGDVIVSP
jgi:hypothetical protein